MGQPKPKLTLRFLVCHQKLEAGEEGEGCCRAGAETSAGHQESGSGVWKAVGLESAVVPRVRAKRQAGRVVLPPPAHHSPRWSGLKGSRGRAEGKGVLEPHCGLGKCRAA